MLTNKEKSFLKELKNVFIKYNVSTDNTEYTIKVDSKTRITRNIHSDKKNFWVQVDEEMEVDTL